MIEINAAQPNANLTFTAGEVSRNLSVPVAAVASAKLRGKLLDSDAQMPTPGRVWVESSDHQLRRAGRFSTNKSFVEKPILELPSMRMAAVPFFYADGQFEIDLPPGKTTVTLERGFEHPLVTETIELRPGEIRKVTLSSRRFLDAKANGWISGDTHIHWVTNAWNVDLPLSDLSLVQRAEDLRVANNLTLLHRTTTDAFVEPSQAPWGPFSPQVIVTITSRWPRSTAIRISTATCVFSICNGWCCRLAPGPRSQGMIPWITRSTRQPSWKHADRAVSALKPTELAPTMNFR